MTATRIVLAAFAVAAVVTVAIVLNLLLLGRASAQNDPVGTLSPRANLPAPAWTVRPARSHHERSGADD